MLVEKDIRSVVDLAGSTLGEDDMAAFKTRTLLSAMTGYAPLIYELRENCGYAEFLAICQKVWNSMETTPELPQNLVCVVLPFLPL